MKKLVIALLATLAVATQLNAQCGLGTPDISCTVSPAYPHTCSDTIPDGEAGTFYQHDITMWFPTSFFEPSAGLTVTMNQVDIQSVSGLPFGMQWTANPATVIPSQNEFTAIRVCGTPFNAGDYTITISIVVQATAFGISQTVNQNVPVHLHINPSTQGNIAFSTTNPSGCTPLPSSFVTNFPSGGNTGYSYFWDLGNGFSTTLETPPPVSYSTGANDTFYIVTHSVSIDTVGYYLTNVQVTNIACTDNPGNDPDVYIKLFNGQGVEVFNNSANNQTGTGPFNYPLNILLSSPPYQLQVWDSDGGLLGADDNCANNNEGSNASVNIVFPPNNPGGTFTIVGQNGGLILNYTLFKPVVDITGTDTIYVYPNPSVPTVTAFPGFDYCEGTQTQLTSTPATQYQWYKADTLLPNATIQHYFAGAPGNYLVQVTNQFGCSNYSDTMAVHQLPAPPQPTISYSGGLLQTDLTNPPYQLQWFYEGFLFAGQTAQTCSPLFDGMYYVRAENTFGCYSYSDTIEVSKVGLNTINAGGLTIGIMPNPASSVVTLYIDGVSNGPVSMGIYSITGQQMATKMLNIGNGVVTNYAETVDVSLLPAGIYVVRFNYGTMQKTLKLFVY